jgi:hypothetical protein
MLFAIAEATIFGLAAAISTLVGVGLAIAAHRSSREKATEKANEEQHLQLLEARAEAERLSAELHQLKMKKSGNETSK